MCFMMHEILNYEKKNILMEKMGKQYSQTPTMFRKYCVGNGEEGVLSLLWYPDTNIYFWSKIFFVHN